MKKRTNYTPEFKTKVVLEVLAEEATINQIAAKYSVNPVVVSLWKKEFLEKAPDVFKKGPSTTEKELEQEKEYAAELKRKVGQLAFDVDWLKKNLKKSSDTPIRKTTLSMTVPGSSEEPWTAISRNTTPTGRNLQ